MNRICAALDVPDAASARALAQKLAGHVGVFKIGLELFCAHGPSIVQSLGELQTPIFLDLKLHDIPQTVENAARALGPLAPAYVTVHASGGAAMIAAARKALPASTKLLAVTVLTSLDAQPGEVLRLARLAVASGADGLVCSVHEVAELRRELGAGPLLVVPGIRPLGAALDDQRRTGTAREAVQAGASLLVIGRPLRDAPDPARAADEFSRELDSL